MAKEPTATERLRRMQQQVNIPVPARRPGRPRKVQPAAEIVEEEDMEASFEPAPVRRSARQPARDATRRTTENTRRGAMVVEGRDGEMLTRRRTQVGDPYHVPGNEIPDGWSYQWNPVAVTNNSEVTIETQNIMHANGWRAVPASRHPGRWTKPGSTGEIVVGGLRLEERPEALTDEALQEGEHKAKQQIRDQAESLQLTKKMPKGFAAGQRYRGTGADVRMSIDKSFELPPSEYEPADDTRE